MNRSLSLLLKPASGMCNLNCRYCFYHDLSRRQDGTQPGRMMEEHVLEAIVRKAYAYADSSVTFGFQGGEPTLRGVDFYRRFVALVKQYNTASIPTYFTLQTNGLLIDDAWADFLRENNFLVGISLDGPSALHDKNRIDRKGNGSFDRALSVAKGLQGAGVAVNILCVITEENARQGRALLRFFRSMGFRYLQFIPCLDPLSETADEMGSFLSPESYGRFLIDTFDCWREDLRVGQYTSIRMFDNLAQMLNGLPPKDCSMRGQCTAGTVIEADGSVYPCDFYVMEKWRLGNILDTGFDALLTGERAVDFVQSSPQLSDVCLCCAYRSLCRSGCRRHREPIHPGQPQNNRFCEAYRMFYAHIFGKRS